MNRAYILIFPVTVYYHLFSIKILQKIFVVLHCDVNEDIAEKYKQKRLKDLFSLYFVITFF